MILRPRRAIGAASLAFLGACSSGGGTPAQIVITNVTIIDVAGGRRLPDQTVVVAGNRITAAGPSSSTPAPRGATRIDGTGKFLIPGLWDMHVHAFTYTFSEFAGPLMIANGVTGARDMGYYVDTTLRWRRDIAAGREVGPRLIVGARVDGNVSHAGYVAKVSTAADGTMAVDTLASRAGRPDFLKIYSWIPREAYFAVAAEARTVNIPFAGHVPYSVTLAEASAAGQRSIEHEDDLMRACSSRDASLRAGLSDTSKLEPVQKAEIIRAQARSMRESYDAGKCAAVMALLAKNRTWVTPTFSVYQPYAHFFDAASTRRDLLKYVPSIVQGGWKRRITDITPTDSIDVRSFYSFERTAELHRAGVRLLAGTDAPLPYVYPGFSLHDELALLATSGLGNLGALRAATLNAADYLGMLDSLGTIEAGKVADLVLLDADPLTDIRNTTRISSVIANGVLFDDSARRLLLDKVERAHVR